MPRQIQRRSSTSLSKTPTRQEDLAITDSGAGKLAASYAYGQTVQALATAYASTANLVGTTVQSVAECSKAYFNYLEECQRTHQLEIWSSTVIAEARQCTRQMEIKATALISEAREQTRRIEIQADITRDHLRERQASREAKMEIVQTFLDGHHRLVELFVNINTSGDRNISIEDRKQILKHRHDVGQRLGEMESALISLANAL